MIMFSLIFIKKDNVLTNCTSYGKEHKEEITQSKKLQTSNNLSLYMANKNFEIAIFKCFKLCFYYFTMMGRPEAHLRVTVASLVVCVNIFLQQHIHEGKRVNAILF